MSGPERGEPPVEAGARVGHQLQHRPVELHDLVLGGADHQPGPARGAAPALAAAVDAPLPAHAQVGVQRQVAFEADEQVLAVGVDRRAPPRPASRSGQRSSAWRGWGVSIDTISLPDERRPDPLRGVVDCVALGHRRPNRRQVATLAPGGAEPIGRIRAPLLHPLLIAASLWAPSAQAASESSWRGDGGPVGEGQPLRSGRHRGSPRQPARRRGGPGMSTRFSYQWLNRKTGAWQPVPGAGSGWLAAGPGLGSQRDRLEPDLRRGARGHDLQDPRRRGAAVAGAAA